MFQKRIHMQMRCRHYCKSCDRP